MQVSIAAEVSTGPVRRVVIPVGPSDREWLAQEQAVLFAEALSVPLVGITVARVPEALEGHRFAYLRQQADRRGVAFRHHIVAGTDPVEELLAELDALDLVIVGSERIGDRHQLPGLAERLLHDAPGPVQVVRLAQRD